MDEVRKARAKVRERESAIWTRVETIKREAHAADGAVRVFASAAAGIEPNKGRRKRLAQTRDRLQQGRA